MLRWGTSLLALLLLAPLSGAVAAAPGADAPLVEVIRQMVVVYGGEALARGAVVRRQSPATKDPPGGPRARGGGIS
ncbi:MAG: hypothetical protein COS73_02505 [Nitrospirae bacterium CG06_land_8_20_14_3_00_70_43]|nr:MAG: hypothetical protein COS73_02505 [Nitrospirae bacterium CG06_land_8_20_14_3_00_70_43]